MLWKRFDNLLCVINHNGCRSQGREEGLVSRFERAYHLTSTTNVNSLDLTHIMVYNSHLMTATFETLDFLESCLRPCLEIRK